MTIQAKVVDRRTEILSDPKLHESVRVVARLRGMSRDVANDIAQQVLLEALTDENLPLDDPEQTGLYLRGAARHKAVDHVRALDIGARNGVRVNEKNEQEPPADPERVALAARVWQFVVGRFPGKSDMLFRHLILGETHAEIAGWYRKQPSSVRADISRMMQTLRNTTFACAFLMIFVGGSSAWHRMARPVTPDEQLSDATSHRVEAPPVAPSAEQLRDRARDWCRQRVWAECLDDVERARRMDPDGHTQQWEQLRMHALEELEGGAWAKPGLPIYPQPKNHK